MNEDAEDVEDAAWNDPAHPPVEGAIDCGGGVWITWASRFNDPNSRHPLVWHWCTQEKWADRPHMRGPSWLPSSVGLHTLVASGTIHLEPSLLWSDCCGKHGYLRDGRWEEV